MEDIVILVPAYKPEKELMLRFLDELKNKFKKIIVIDDGSGSGFEEFFNQIEAKKIHVIHHEINKGKGQAIKTGFDYILKNDNNFLGTITADCDGQHTVNDIEKCAKKLREYPKDLVVGCRDFNEPNVPPRSKFGNKLTRNIFKIFIGINITDTQSGLRGFGKDLMEKFLNTEGNRYEYETNMLIDCKTYDITIREVTIETVYLDNNKGSHFNPIIDSLKIYKLFLKYVLASISSFILDIAIFAILINIMNFNEKIIVATVIARIISSIYNFVLNARVVFKKSTKTSIIKYIILAVIQMLMSGCIVTLISNYTPINATIIKIIVDTIIFIVNFIIQREWVFKTKEQ